MTNLVNQLTEKTQDLKNQYITKTQEWATEYYNKCLSKKSWREIDWCKHFGLVPTPVNAGTSMEFLSFPKGFYNTSNHKIYLKSRDEIIKTVSYSLDQYLEKEKLYAERHYESSIIKLADRIVSKGLAVDNFTVTSASVGVNINIVITDNILTVKAFTIVASGEVQRPHYRYLVK